ncbi:hypothetical protein F4819DRAFT_498124 [Hypoxylon fuscum]|nr:hypothetical protein F4819DRAFT_498124 [Hypoxylon fuscum]
MDLLVVASLYIGLLVLSCLHRDINNQLPPVSNLFKVLCVGLPRSGTESLQQALIKLGYDNTLHGFDIILEDPNYCQQWVRLSRKKWFGSLNGDDKITTADFDALLGHAVAVTDTAGSVFAAEIIAAYPDAKVILNRRKDIDKWHHSLVNTLGRSFWAWHLHIRFLYPGIFRALDGNIKTGVVRNGKWVYHGERLLEWTVEDGWEPLSVKESIVAKRFLFSAVKTVVLLEAIMVVAAVIWCNF